MNERFNSLLVALGVIFVSLLLICGCTYRTLEIRFRDVEHKNPVAGVTVDASEIHILKPFPTRASAVSDSNGIAKLRLRDKAEVRILVRRLPEMTAESFECGSPFYGDRLLVMPWRGLEMWIPQPALQNNVEATWMIRDE